MATPPDPREPVPPTPPPPPRHGMVEWYDPCQLLATGIDVLISAAMAQRFDYRTLEDVGPPQPAFDYRLDHRDQPRSEIWLDYLADTGDGWNPTFAVASLVAQRRLEVAGLTLERGDVMVLGGDEVYPRASKRNYRERLVAPFEAALPHTEPPHPHLFAIPGNHDWYDGLVSFSRRFTQQRWIGGWQTRQRRSYFALKLPHRWWLWAVDVHLESDVDVGQRNYFRDIAWDVQPGDRIILVSAEPDWLSRDITDPQAESNLAFLEEKIIKPRRAKIYLWLAGDQHHYRRHEDRRDPRLQRITSGGGGAYLCPTHGPLFGAASSISRQVVGVGPTEFLPRCTYPSPATSFRLSLLNTVFLLKNWKFGILTGLGYAALTWGYEPNEPPIAESLLLYPARLVWMLVILVGFVFYADRERPAFRWVGGGLHGAVHITAALLVAGATAAWDLPQGYRLLLNFAGGATLGPTIVGFYLLIALNLFDAHRSEAFSALRIQDYKHFLRLHITARGVLEIFPLAIRRVPRHREARGRYTLIEGPIRIDPR